MSKFDNLVFFDFEVNSLTHKEPIEVCFFYKDTEMKSLFSCTHPIAPEAQEVNHILESDLQGFPKFEETKELKVLTKLYDKGCTYVAHNLQFDLRILAKYLNHSSYKEIPGICTQVVAKYYISKILKLDEDSFKSYRMQYLRYYFKLDEIYNLKGVVPHRAEADVVVLKALYDYLYTQFELAGIEDVENFFRSLTAEYFKPQNYIIWFGKHKKRTLGEIYKDDPQYITWLEEKFEADEELACALTEFFDYRESLKTNV